MGSLRSIKKQKDETSQKIYSDPRFDRVECDRKYVCKKVGFGCVIMDNIDNDCGWFKEYYGKS
jgi:hypothetical protein